MSFGIPSLPRDPRWYQIGVLSLLLAVGLLELDFALRAIQVALVFATALATQWLGDRWSGRPAFSPLSAVITSLSLTLLLRTDALLIAAAAACIAIASKFLVRVRGKHLFNPANAGIVVLALATDSAWVSTGQWGSAAIGALGLCGLGFLVLTRARRAETTLAFLGCYAALLLGRALWLGDPLAIPLHQLTNGALLIFAFFMISDPKTTPDAAVGRLLYGALVAAAAFTVQFQLFLTGAPLYALFFCSPIVPLLDWALRGRRYRWLPAASPQPLRQGV